MKRTIACFMLLASMGVTACSQSPSAPTSSPSIAGQLRWNVVSTSCGPVATPTMQPDFSAATITEQPDGSVQASWDVTGANNRNQTLYARFVRENGGWAMCSWDVADI